jgi:hypothetical protein
MSFDLNKLGVKQNIPKVSFTEYSGLIQSESKWGKSTLVSLLPKTILVAFEKGFDALVIDYIDCVRRKRSVGKNLLNLLINWKIIEKRLEMLLN